MTDVTKTESTEGTKKEVVEKRIRPTVIRRRKKKVEPKEVQAATAADEIVAEEKTSAQTFKEKAMEANAKAEAKQEAPEEEGAPRPKLVGKIDLPKTQAKRGHAKKAEDVVPEEVGPRVGVVGHIEKVAPTLKDDWRDRLKKAPKKKKSRAELETDDILRAGGVQHFANQMLDVSRTTSSERVFEPTRKKKVVRREFQKTKITKPKAIKKVIKIEESIPVSTLSQTMGVKARELLKKLADLGVEADMNASIDFDTVTLISEEYGFTVEQAGIREDEILAKPETKTDANLKPRPPVVTVMGHVDHGKTSILDYIKKTKIADGEAGGITQHIGAYEVNINNKTISFIDTPGHEAFTLMRARGAQATDIVILVVAADDGPMPQTIEAMNHAQAAGVPIIVAVNKCDLAGANPDRAKQALAERGLVPEDWGGEAIYVQTSAKTGDGISDLLDMILLQAEVLDLKADPKTRAKGIVLEGKLEKGRGPVASVLVQEGTLKRGDYIVCGTFAGKIRAMINAQGKQVKEAPPSMPVEILGLEGVPNSGDEMVAVDDDKNAKIVADQRKQKLREETVKQPIKFSLEDLASGQAEELKVLIKGDVVGSVEAVRDSLEKLSTDKVKVKVILSAVGIVSESDVMLASASNAIILGFNVTSDKAAAESAKREGVEIRTYRIIYEMLDEVKKAMVGLLEPLVIEKPMGAAEVREVYKITKVGTIAGCIVTNGKITRKAKVRLVRDGAIVHEGTLSSLKRFKDDAKEVTDNQECGIGIARYQDIKVGDVIEAFETEEKAAEL